MTTKIKVTKEERSDSNVIPVKDMKPLDVAVVVESSNEIVIGDVVGRAPSSNRFELINLSCLGVDNCWGEGVQHSNIVVRLVDAEITVKVTERPE